MGRCGAGGRHVLWAFSEKITEVREVHPGLEVRFIGLGSLKPKTENRNVSWYMFTSLTVAWNVKL